MKNIRKLLLTLYWSFAPNNYSPGDPRAFPGVTMNSHEVISITVLQSFDFPPDGYEFAVGHFFGVR